MMGVSGGIVGLVVAIGLAAWLASRGVVPIGRAVDFCAGCAWAIAWAVIWVLLFGGVM